MAGSVVLTNTFADLSGDQQASTLDTNFGELVSGVNALGTFNNYLVDSGSVNALAVTVSSPQTVSYSAGLFLQVTVANTNTGACTINVNSLGAISIINQSGSALVAGQLIAGAIALLQYNGSSFLLLNSSASRSGSFTGTLTGMNGTAPTGTVQYRIDPSGQLCTLYIASAISTASGSASGYMGLSGLASAVQPAVAQVLPCIAVYTPSLGTSFYAQATAYVSGSTIAFALGGTYGQSSSETSTQLIVGTYTGGPIFGNWSTADLLQGIPPGWSITYALT